jgi:hypothetical protein
MRSVSFIFFFLISSFTLAQTNVKDSLLYKFRNFREHTLQEKVYLHVDNGFYIAGEQMYFSAYVLDGAFHKPLSLSKVVYVELIDQSNKVIAHAKLEMIDGRGNGVIAIPTSAESGPHVIRAYTHWMKNFSPDLFFHRPISVVNTFKQLERPVVRKGKEILVNFFPEGGNLVAGVKNKIAFKITERNGYGLVLKGFLTAKDSRDTILRFSPTRFGMGSFVLKPDVAKQYTAHVIDAEGKIFSYDLPKIYQSGYRMQLTENESVVRVEVASANFSETGRDVYLFVHARNIIEKVERKLVANGMTIFEIDKKTLREGISHLTVFDWQLQPQCQRLFFKPVESIMSIKVAHRPKVGTREQFHIQLNSQDQDGKNLLADVSVAVYRLDSLAVVPSDGIAEYVWLKSDLNGFIEDPDHYFKNSTDNETRDLLMLTHGWSRFKWEELLSAPPSLTYLPEYAGHLITGSVKRSNGAPGNSRLTWLASPDKTIKPHSAIVNSNGEVQFQTNGLYGTRRLIIQPSAEDEDFNFTLVSPLSTAFATFANGEFNIDRANRSALLRRSVAMQARPLYKKELVSRTTIPMDTLPFYGKPDASYKLDDYTRFPNIDEVLREYVPAVRVRKRNDGFHFYVNNENNSDVFPEDPLILLDGVPVTAARILEYNPLNVQRLDVVARRHFLSAASTAGIVSFVTYRGDFNQMQLGPSTFQVDYQGLQQRSEYFTPVYETAKQKSSPAPDLRYLVYWNASAKTNRNGLYSTQFYTSDVKGKYVIVVEGISHDGKVGRTVSTFEVGD